MSSLKCILLALVVCCAVSLSMQEVAVQPVAEAEGVEAKESQNSLGGKLFLPVKYQKYTTNTVYSLFTSTIYNFCISGSIGAAGVGCGRRRRRRRSLSTDDEASKDLIPGELTDEDIAGLSGSQSTNTVSAAVKGDDGKILKWTVYTSTTTTATATVKFTNLLSTLSISLICYQAGLSVPVVCGG